MEIQFSKYHGAGNDFVLIDNRLSLLQLSEKEIAFLCNRRLGIGADGLMLLEDDEQLDFKMRYFNADGKEATMCGNGGRCIVAFAHEIGIKKEEYVFRAVDGLHKAFRNNDTIRLQMIDVETSQKYDQERWFLDTGSPHLVCKVDDLNTIDVEKEGKRLRYDKRFGETGCNVNFIQIKDNTIAIRTYERGVEAETLACGTGAVASAIVAHQYNPDITFFRLNALGGELKVTFDKQNGKYTNLWLEGPATFVFKGYLTLGLD